MKLPANPNTFANYPLDRSGHRRKDAAWLEAALNRDDAAIHLFHRDRPLLSQAGRRMAPSPMGPGAVQMASPDAPIVFLGVDEVGAPHFAAMLHPDLDPTEPPLESLGVFTDLRSAAMQLSGPDAAVLGCAKAILDWHERHRFCAKCGAGSQPQEGGWKRVCASCAAEHFPRVDPVAIMLPVRDGRCMLGRQARFPAGMYSALAGFIEPGESIEEGCAREVLEEVGLIATAVRYVGAQPWPFPSQLMIGLIAEVEPGDVVLEDEIDAVVWLTKEEARAALSGGVDTDRGRIFAPPPFAIAHHIVQAWLAEP
jgi:NAD+ diphosphatase